MSEQRPIRGLSEKAHGIEMGVRDREHLRQVFPPGSLSNKRGGFCSIDCLQLLGISIQMDLFPDKSWPETRLPSETAVGWDLHAASSEVNIKQTRSGTSCKKLW